MTKVDRGRRGTYMRVIRPNSGFSAGNMAYQGASQLQIPLHVGLWLISRLDVLSAKKDQLLYRYSA